MTHPQDLTGPGAVAGARESTPKNLQLHKRILIVNDNSGILFALRAVLSDLDVQIATAMSGQQALMQLLATDFSVILLDVKMAGTDGFETARLIRSRPRSRNTPIIFLTSHRATDLDRDRGYALGAADYLFMPVAPEVLKLKVQALLDLDAAAPPVGTQGAPHPWPAFPSSAATENVIDCADAERLIVQHAGEYIALLDPGGAWLYAGASYQHKFGIPIQPPGHYLDIVHPSDRERVRAALAAMSRGEVTRRLQYRVGDDDECYFEADCNLIHGPGGQLAQMVLVARDITERKEMGAYVQQLAMHDSLTGLPNRLLLTDRLSQATAYRGHIHEVMAVLFVDLDHFKDVNDSLGHAAGDRLLQDVAERLTSIVRDGDTVARLGGDEFVVVLLGLHDSNAAALVAEKIVALVASGCQIDGHQLRVGSSIGIAIFPDDSTDPDTLLRCADTAMYDAKRRGGSRYSFFTAQMQETASRKLALGTALQRAIREGEFCLYYQPKVSARSGAICGFEALIRWPQEHAPWISPTIFIPVAEESGRIEPIGRWVIAETARELRRWRDLGFGDIPIAVNVSALQLERADVADALAAVLAEADVAPRLLEVEITETGVMSNPEQAITVLGQIHALGIAIAIDDFGTGYSSLAYLKRFPIDKLKIDASFVRALESDASDAAIVVAIITLAHVMKMTVIAEGVETAAQVQFLVSHGCDEMQGHFFGAAVSNEDAVALLRRGPYAF